MRTSNRIKLLSVPADLLFELLVRFADGEDTASATEIMCPYNPLPTDAQLEDAQWNWERQAFDFVISSSEFDEIVEGCVLYRLDPVEVVRTVVEQPEGAT